MNEVPADAQRPTGPDPHEDANRSIFEGARS